MPFFVWRLLARLGRLRGWATPVVVIVFVFATSWPLMALVEPGGSDLVRPGTYWWYFLVTAATVGYGDVAPTTAAGRVVGGYVIIGGIAALTTVITNLAGAIERTKGRRMRGATTVADSGHVVLLGYTAGRTERIITELVSYGYGCIALVAGDEVATHPVPEQEVQFVRGSLTDEAVLRRAGAHRASTVLVDADDDNAALAVAVLAHHVRPAGSHLVVTLRDMERAALVSHVDAEIRCVQWHAPRMVTEELCSPGITDVYTHLMTHGGANTYSVRLPDALGPLAVEHCQAVLRHRYEALLLAARAGGELLVNPGWDKELAAGATLYYIGPQRLTSDELSRALRG